MSELKSTGKPFEISKWEVWEAWKKVKENKGGPGVDGMTIEDFEKDLKNNLFKIWNRMSCSYSGPVARSVWPWGWACRCRWAGPHSEKILRWLGLRSSRVRS
ncbi:MAG: hypothetical protein NVS2B9_21120 [Myxococcales bacterium]